MTLTKYDVSRLTSLTVKKAHQMSPWNTFWSHSMTLVRDTISTFTKNVYASENKSKCSLFKCHFYTSTDFGPLYRTTNADEFKQQINVLQASGGGDEPELCLSGLRVRELNDKSYFESL